MNNNLKECPKKERCRKGDKCVNHDTFRGEYLCFDGITWHTHKRKLTQATKSESKKGGS